MGKFHWFNIFRYFNAIVWWVALVTFLVWCFKEEGYVFVVSASWIVLTTWILTIPMLLANKKILPRWMEYPTFEAYRFHLKDVSKKISPLIDKKLRMGYELELPRIFWEKGAVVKEVSHWAENKSNWVENVENIKKSFQNAIDKVKKQND